MKIKNLNELSIVNDENINSKFLSIDLKKFALNCKIYKGDFFLDSLKY